jgi:group I intron endonuclease
MSTPVAIYKIVNTLNGMMYIGQSVNPEYRARRHFWKNNGCVKLRNAIEKYGKQSFVFSILCWCTDKQDANELEDLLIAECDTRNNGYNITPGGFGTGAGKENSFYGKTHTPETRKKLSELNIGRVMSDSAKKKIAEANTKRVVSEATKEKLRARPKSEICSIRTAEANKKRVWTAESREKLAAHSRGKTMSEETKAKVAAANRARVWDAAARAKLSAAKTKIKGEL